LRLQRRCLQGDEIATELDLAAIEATLRERLAEIDAEIKELTKPPENASGISFGKRIGDGTSQAIDRFAEVGVAQEIEPLKERIQRALVKLEEGTYGTCDNCGKPIVAGRLNAAPESALCIVCARNAR
jgi:DnaK suppressor protein